MWGAHISKSAPQSATPAAARARAFDIHTAISANMPCMSGQIKDKDHENSKLLRARLYELTLQSAQRLSIRRSVVP
jgi:hypothetical protein